MMEKRFCIECKYEKETDRFGLNKEMPCLKCFGYDKWEPKEPPFEPEYFSGLNWRDAEKLVGKLVEFSDNGEKWTLPKTLIELRDHNALSYHQVISRFAHDLEWYYYIRTCPETYAHPTINIGGVELPRPEVDAPKKGTEYFYLGSMMRPCRGLWHNTPQERMELEKGLIHLAEDRVQAWADWWENTVMAAVRGGCDENQN
jgi:hypothetical protein